MRAFFQLVLRSTVPVNIVFFGLIAFSADVLAWGDKQYFLVFPGIGILAAALFLTLGAVAFDRLGIEFWSKPESDS